MPPGLFGFWVSYEMEEETYVMHRSDAFDPNLYGFAFNEDGRFIEHKNISWCGTPPIVFQEYKGTWKRLSDNIYEINVGFWGGQIMFEMVVQSVDEEFLKFTYNFK